MKRVLPLLLLPLAALAIWLFTKRTDLPDVPFAKASRESIVNTLSTNGKVEPVEYQEVRVESQGLLSKLSIHEGEQVSKGQVIAQVNVTGVREELQAAEAREAQSQAELQTLRQGGRSSDVAEMEGQLTRAQSDRQVAQANLDSIERLVKKDAAPKIEAEQARVKVQSLDVEMANLQRRRQSLVSRNDVSAGQARVRETAANVALIKTRASLTSITAPLSGTVYSLPAHNGAYLNPGDPIASIGKLNPVRVRVYVDEPEMGRVAVHQPVRITWDAMAGKQWNGTVERRPIEVIALGTRQVGEVLCTIDNPGGDLVPGTNVNAFIQTNVSRNALTIPKAALRNDDGVGVYVLGDRNAVRWQRVKTGVNSALKVEIVDGLKDGEAVALQTDQALKNGVRVTPVGELGRT